MAELNPPLAMQNRTDHSALTMRTLADALTGASAAIGANDLKVTQRAAGANMSVDVAGGMAFIDGTESATQGAYVVRSDATPTNVTIAASSPSLPRIDLVVAKVQDAFYSGATNAWSIVAVTGTAASSPVAPAAPVNSLVLAQVSVAAAAATVVNANITDKRVIASGRLYSGDFPCTSTTRPPVPWQGMTIYETDTKVRYLWDGAAWQLTGKAGGVPYAMAAGATNYTWAGATSVTPLVSPAFPAGRFTVAPIVTVVVGLSGASGIANNYVAWQTFNISTSGFDAQGLSAGAPAAGTVARLAWQAIQMTPSAAAG